MSVLANIYKKLFALASHTHTKSQITDFGSYAAVSHGTHVSTSTCVTSINNQKGDVTLEIPSGIFSPEEYCCPIKDENDMYINCTDILSAAGFSVTCGGAAPWLVSELILTEDFRSFRFLRFDWVRKQYPGMSTSRIISTQYLMEMIPELETKPSSGAGFCFSSDNDYLPLWFCGYDPTGMKIYVSMCNTIMSQILGFD